MSSKEEGQIEIQAEEDKNERIQNLIASANAWTKDKIQTYEKHLVWLEEVVVRQRLNLSECEKKLAGIYGDNDKRTELLQLSDRIKQSIDKLEAEIIDGGKLIVDYK